MQTVPDVEDLFQPLEEASRHQFLPSFTGRLALGNAERELIALPAWLGGLGISLPTRYANWQQMSCSQVTAPLVDLINSNAIDYARETQQEQKEMKAKVQSRTVRKLQRKQKLLKHHSQRVSRMQWSRQVREGRQHGSLPFQ